MEKTAQEDDQIDPVWLWEPRDETEANTIWLKQSIRSAGGSRAEQWEDPVFPEWSPQPLQQEQQCAGSRKERVCTYLHSSFTQVLSWVWWGQEMITSGEQMMNNQC